MQTENEQVEIWGGIECTINRVNNEYFDQLQYAGYYKRKNDIDIIAATGVKALRYPVLWEKYQPRKNVQICWQPAENDLEKLSNYNIKPIIGLVHHGSGPKFVNFLNGSFEKGLAKYAELVAQQFPFVQYYTPVNEPLTTARFCGLYGHWYPHKKDDLSFAKIVISECKGTVMAMQAIRKINPHAKLIQTEDLGKTHSTPLLKYQADFENRRRWLAIDLLCGKVTPESSMWKYLLNIGVAEAELYFFLENSCPPDILGLNYYVTSERFIDEKIEHYPAHTHGTNYIHDYADVEAVRVGEKAFEGAHSLIKDMWEKFKIPIAITEVQLNCHREEQVRWFYKMWQTANELKKENVDIKAVTAWAMLGSFGWNKLLTTKEKDYESGAFDVRSGELRPLALAKLLQKLNHQQNNIHPLLNCKGWWERDVRIIYHQPKIKLNNKQIKINTQPLLILGKTGTLGNAFARVCENRDIAYELLSRKQVDICKPETIDKVIAEMKPWAVVNATGYVRVDDAEKDRENCFAINSVGPLNLAKYCDKYKIPLLSFSSDLVFDGNKNAPYVETDAVAPLNNYGRSKAAGEQNLLKYSNTLIVRTSAFFGPWDEYNFISILIRQLNANKTFAAVKDVFVSPTYVPDLAHTCIDLLIDEETGIWHIANDGEITWAQLAKTVAEKLNLNTDLIEEKLLKEMPFAAARPMYSVLQSKKGIKLPALHNALERFFAETNYAERLINSTVTA